LQLVLELLEGRLHEDAKHISGLRVTLLSALLRVYAYLHFVF
jgi:hypothetical protein